MVVHCSSLYTNKSIQEEKKKKRKAKAPDFKVLGSFRSYQIVHHRDVEEKEDRKEKKKKEPF